VEKKSALKVREGKRGWSKGRVKVEVRRESR
jgi:hypothetical protein